MSRLTFRPGRLALVGFALIPCGCFGAYFFYRLGEPAGVIGSALACALGLLILDQTAEWRAE